MILLIIIASIFLGFEGPAFLFRPIEFVKRKFNLLRLKPFDCECCLAFWISICISLIKTDVVTAILIGTVVFNTMKLICKAKYYLKSLFDK